ncbi:type 1 glutamine amidotransferase [Labedella endophytica]|jgi:CobQ-like glutamine amidotransferase family enzyme|uniref:Lipid II isoglutaminyl synthase (glutamine-hydrolyzing) subunit GatD n=1 Tax=Labedella endophytica TaxID=1523160 RepID=A0A433JS05_9MICO|nr:cobyric acid synthase [Labedella endophytica]RUR00769.1 cobyric acid synthase [Labedella endophytica]
MSVADETVVILQLFPAELGVTGDSGNVLALATRLERAGGTATVLHHRIGDALPAERPDIVVIGNGPLSAVRSVIGDLRRIAPELTEWVAAGIPLLAVGAGMEALGERIVAPDGETIDGIGVFPVTTDRAGARHAGYLVVESSVGRIVGFEDHRTVTTRRDGAAPFGQVTSGVTGTAGFEDGVRVSNAIGTRVQGPVLPLNPVLTDFLIARALERRGLDWSATPAHAELDRLAEEARGVILANIDHAFSTI